MVLGEDPDPLAGRGTFGAAAVILAYARSRYSKPYFQGTVAMRTVATGTLTTCYYS